MTLKQIVVGQIESHRAYTLMYRKLALSNLIWINWNHILCCALQYQVYIKQFMLILTKIRTLNDRLYDIYFFLNLESSFFFSLTDNTKHQKSHCLNLLLFDVEQNQTIVVLNVILLKLEAVRWRAQQILKRSKSQRTQFILWRFNALISIDESAKTKEKTH